MEDRRGHEGGQNALDEFRDGRMEFLGYGVARIYDLVANGDQNVRATFGQAQRRKAIRLERSAVSSSGADKWDVHQAHLNHVDGVPDIQQDGASKF